MLSSTFFGLIAFLGLGLPVAAALILLAIALSLGYAMVPLTSALGETTWTSMSSALMFTIPLFVLMGEIFLRSGIATRMYQALSYWIRLPGRLMHVNVASSAIFAATSGSGAATAATIGTVALPEMKKYGYSKKLFLGSIAAGGTLGILIPSSINMIIYAAVTNTSIVDLYVAGMVPRGVMAIMFSGLICVTCLVWKGATGHDPHASWSDRIASLPHLVPPIILFIIVLAPIYLGYATPTESAAIGVVGALFLAWWSGGLSMTVLQTAFEGTIRVTGMLILIVSAALFLNFVLVSIGASTPWSTSSSASSFRRFRSCC